MVNRKKNTLLSGSPFLGILIFGIPYFISSLVSVAYSWIDGILLGKTNSAAFTAISLSGYLIFFGTSFASGFASGATVRSSELYGQSNREEVKKDIASSLLLMAFFAILTSSIMLMLVRPLIVWSGCPEGAVADELSVYLYLIFGAYIPVLFFSSYFASLFRAVDDPKPALLISIVTCISSILMDLLFILLLHYGAMGVALGTIISSGISLLISLFVFWKRHPDLLPKKKDFSLSKARVRACLHNSLPNGLQSSFIGVALFLYQRSINSFGADAINGYGVSNKASSLALIVVNSFTTSSLVFISLNKGAGNKERLRKGLKDVGIFLFAYCLISSVLLLIIRKDLCSFFLGEEEAKNASFFCEAFVLYMPLTLLLNSFLSYLRYILLGLEKAWWSFASCLVEALIRILFTVIAVSSMGYMGLVYCDLFCFVGGIIVAVLGLSFKKPRPKTIR